MLLSTRRHVCRLISTICLNSSRKEVREGKKWEKVLDNRGNIEGKINGIFAPVSPGTHPRNPAAWTLHRLCLQLPAPAGQHAGSVWGASPGCSGVRAWARPGVADRGGTTAHGSAQVQHAHRRWDDATGRGLSRIRSVLGDPGPGQAEEEQTPAGDAAGYA